MTLVLTKIEPVTEFTVEQLKSVGANLWERNGKRRAYFNDFPEMLGWTIRRYKTGNISSVYCHGSRVSNTKATEAMWMLSSAKFYYDLKTGEFCGNRELGEYDRDELEQVVRARLSNQ